jgi:hypothetical protein
LTNEIRKIITKLTHSVEILGIIVTGKDRPAAGKYLDDAGHLKLRQVGQVAIQATLWVCDVPQQFLNSFRPEK